jgi:hypothetical protein
MLLAVAAGTGALVVAPLSMQQARAAQLPIAGSPALVAGLTAGLGAVAGILAATAVLSEGAVAWNVGIVAGLTWFTGLASLAPSLGPTDPLAYVRLGVPDLSSQAGETGQRVAVLAMPVAALLIATAVAGLARWLGRPVVAVALSGLGGPALLAVAYLIAGPGVRNGHNDQAAPYWGSLIAVAAGLLGSVLVAVVRRPGAAATADGTPIEPTGTRDAVFPEQAQPPWHSPPPPTSDARPTSDASPTSDARPASEARTTTESASVPAPEPSHSQPLPRRRPAKPSVPAKTPTAMQAKEPPTAVPPVPTAVPAIEPVPLMLVPKPRSAPKPDRRSGRAAAEEEYLGWVEGLGGRVEAQAGAAAGPAVEADETNAGGGRTERSRRRKSRRPAVGSGRHQAD